MSQVPRRRCGIIITIFRGLGPSVWSLQIGTWHQRVFVVPISYLYLIGESPILSAARPVQMQVCTLHMCFLISAYTFANTLASGCAHALE